VVVGNLRKFPWQCLHMFVPAKRNGLDGHGKCDLQTQWIGCGLGGIGVQDTKTYGPAV